MSEKFPIATDQLRELADAGIRHAEGLTAQLDKQHWKPRRSHVEQARNSIAKLAAALRAVPAQQEPVAWRTNTGAATTEKRMAEIWRDTYNFTIEPLYTALSPQPTGPQAREAPAAWGDILETFKGGYLSIAETIAALEQAVPSSPALVWGSHNSGEAEPSVMPAYGAGGAISPADIAKDCAKIAEGHVGVVEGPCNYSNGYDEACRDIAKAIRDAHGSFR